MLVPLYVIVYKRAPKVGIFLQFFLIIANACVLMWMSYHFNFRASPLATEGYYIFSYIVNKPYMKFVTHSVGVLAAFAYMNLLAYRKLQSDEEKKEKHPILHFWLKYIWLSRGLNIAAGYSIYFALASGFPSYATQYKVPLWKDMLYYGFDRTLLVTAAMIMLFTSMMGHFPLASIVLRSDYMRAISRFSFDSALLTPIVITLILCGQQDIIFLINLTSTFIAVGLMITSTLLGFLVFIFIDYPMSALLNVLVISKISYTRTLRAHFTQLKNSEEYMDTT